MFERLRFLRKEKGLTCEDMAELLGLDTKGAYSKKELGRTKFSLDDAKKISNALGKSIDDIFFTNEVSFKDTKSRKPA
ncbi:helix-turn-helix transcriptional regulator [Mitsuokella multacida]|uniref:helix-turn-helix transcriptional regulator n=1 Tax=Mitsuokella multacida TaxID=52226 RepID=UPI002666A3D4|nr:helix-turn-helix transcriptional regulator [Mitsuokella multacida]